MRARCRHFLVVLGLAFVTWALDPTATLAHEPGTTRVVATFAVDGSYAFDLTTDASVLLARLERARKQLRSTPTSADDLQHSFDLLCADVTQHLTIRFDGTAAVPRATCLVDRAPSSQPMGPLALAPEQIGAVDLLGVTVTLTGVAPPNARAFQWMYDLTATPYALSVRIDAFHSSEAVWLDGGQESTALPVARAPAPPPGRLAALRSFRVGFARVLPRGLATITFVLGLCLTAGRAQPFLGQVATFAVTYVSALLLTLYGAMVTPVASLGWLVGTTLASVIGGNLLAAGSSAVAPAPRRAGLARHDLAGRPPRWSGRLTIALVALCGLVHGMDAASIIPEAISPGVRLGWIGLGLAAGTSGALVVVALVGLFIVAGWAADRDTYRQRVLLPGTAVLALTAVAWSLQRP